MSEGNAAVEVTPADREEFAKLCDIQGGPNVMPSYVRMGQADAHPGVQAFARHRLSATTSDETARLREYYAAAEAVMPGGMGVTDDMWRRLIAARAALQSQDIPS